MAMNLALMLLYEKIKNHLARKFQYGVNKYTGGRVEKNIWLSDNKKN